MLKSNPQKYNESAGYGVFHNGERLVPISVWRDDPTYERYPYVLWFDKE